MHFIRNLRVKCRTTAYARALEHWASPARKHPATAMPRSHASSATTPRFRSKRSLARSTWSHIFPCYVLLFFSAKYCFVCMFASCANQRERQYRLRARAFRSRRYLGCTSSHSAQATAKDKATGSTSFSLSLSLKKRKKKKEIPLKYKYFFYNAAIKIVIYFFYA